MNRILKNCGVNFERRVYVTRGINFYFVLVVSLAVVVLNHLYVRRRKGGGLYTDRPF